MFAQDKKGWTVSLNLLYVNTRYQGGGAEKVTRQLYEKMAKEENVEVFYLAGRYSAKMNGVDVVYGKNILINVYNVFKRNITNNARIRDYLFRKKIISIIKRNRIDIVHLHNIHGNYMGIMDVVEIRKYCKVVWTLHDMWALTGHCAYPIQCDKWKTDGCKYCCNLKLYPKLRIDIANYIYQIKRKAFANRGIIFVVPSKWLMKNCEQSFLKEETKLLINNGVDIDLYTPKEKEKLRKKYKILQDKIVLMFAPSSMKNPYKGIEVLENALKLVKRKENYELVIVGDRKHINIEKEYICHYMGYVNDDKKMNDLYNLSDVFLLPSYAENFPCSVLESMAAATPVIASRTGGIVEQIDDETGWLFDMGDAKQLAYIIDRLVDKKDKLSVMGAKCRRKAEKYFSEEKMVHDYMNLYAKISNENQGE